MSTTTTAPTKSNLSTDPPLGLIKRRALTTRSDFFDFGRMSGLTVAQAARYCAHMEKRFKSITQDAAHRELMNWLFKESA